MAVKQSIAVLANMPCNWLPTHWRARNVRRQNLLSAHDRQHFFVFASTDTKLLLPTGERGMSGDRTCFRPMTDIVFFSCLDWHQITTASCRRGTLAPMSLTAHALPCLTRLLRHTCWRERKRWCIYGKQGVRWNKAIILPPLRLYLTIVWRENTVEKKCRITSSPIRSETRAAGVSLSH